MASSEKPTERALSFVRLPDRLDGWRVLALGGNAGEDYLTDIGASDFVSLERPSEEDAPEAGAFDLAICDCELECDAHPLAIYAWLRRALKPKGVLIAGSTVLPDPTRSRHARFLHAPDAGEASRWVPGRLAFRWMVEVSGFDVDGWLGERAELGKRTGLAHLQAKATDRTPALDLARQPLDR